MALPLSRDFVSGGAALAAEDIEDLLGGAFTSPLSTLDISYNDPGNAFEFDVDQTFNFGWTGEHTHTSPGGAETKLTWDFADPLTGVQNFVNVLGAGGSLAGGRMTVLATGGTWDVDGNPSPISAIVFNWNTVWRLSTTADNMNNVQIFKVSGTMDIDTANAIANVGGPYEAFQAVPAFTATGGGSGLLVGFSGFKVAPTFATGWTLQGTSEMRGFIFEPGGTGAAAVQRYVGVDINPLADATTLNVSLRSIRAAYSLRHAGPGVFAANAAPTSAGVGLEVQSVTQALLVSRMTGAQMNAIVAPQDGMIVYVTDNATVPGPNFYSRNAGAWVAGV